MNDLREIIASKESGWLDFKREFHENKAKLLHDILCLCNSIYEGDRFIVFGVTNDKKIYGVENDPNKKTNSDLHDFLRQIHLNKIPKIELTFHQIDGHDVGLLKINNAPQKPYFVRKDYQIGKICVRAGVVYSRLGDSNISHNETAPEDHIELMWRERIEYNNQKLLSFEENFPVDLDDPKSRVLEVLGKPDAEGWKVLHYYSVGIEVSLDQHFDTVDSLTITHLPSGVAFDGTLFGIKLDDSFRKIREMIGEPSYWGLSYEDSSLAVWEIEDELLIIRIWRNREGFNNVPFQQLGKARSITFCKRKSFAGYIALVAKAIKQIRDGKIPAEFERKDIPIKGIELSSDLFHEQYEFIGARPALYGGAEILVGLPESEEIIIFWIYPLRWVDPVIRAIYKLQGSTEEIDSDQNTED